MKSLCIKTNNSNIINYLTEDFNKLNLSDVYISISTFKIYKNVIIHYKGTDIDLFINSISSLLANAIILFFEEQLINNIINSEFFYFTPCEKNSIKSLALSTLKSDFANYYYNYNCIFTSLATYISENKSLILNGFVYFRLKEYVSSLENFVSCCVNDFIITKEYQDLISILKLYINSKSPSQEFNEVHLIYINNNKALLTDKNKQMISTSNSSHKILSDISFSNNDFVFNTLIELCPEKIHIHLIHSTPDEFINTLELIFENKLSICTDCNICEFYKIISYTNE